MSDSAAQKPKTIILMIHPNGAVVRAETRAEYEYLKADGFKPIGLTQRVAA